MKIKKQIEELVADGNLDEAIKKIRNLNIEDIKLQSEIASLSGRYIRWQNNYHLGTTDSEKELNLIAQSILYYAGKCEGYIDRDNLFARNNTNNKPLIKNINIISISLVIGCGILGIWIFALKNQVKQLNQENLLLQTKYDSIYSEYSIYKDEFKYLDAMSVDIDTKYVKDINGNYNVKVQYIFEKLIIKNQVGIRVFIEKKRKDGKYVHALGGDKKVIDKPNVERVMVFFGGKAPWEEGIYRATILVDDYKSFSKEFIIKNEDVINE